MASHSQIFIKPLFVIPLSHNHNSEKHKAEKNALSMRQKLSRILQIDTTAKNENQGPSDAPNSEIMIPKVVVRPNPFFSSITLDVTCAQGKHVIVRMFDEDDKIVKMFSWFLVKGINITNISEVEFLPTGVYSLDIVDLEGDILYSTHISKS
ncbi:hypothetical protein ABIE54_002823 [Chitinophagaceae bacterium OAS944]